MYNIYIRGGFYFMRKYKHAIILFAILIYFTSISGISGDTITQVPDSVRIGLVTYYKQVSNIHFYNNSVIPGFVENGSFSPESTIQTSGKDFWFSPATKLYIESDQTFATYEEALSKVTPIREAGYKAYATLMAKNTWKVFAGHKSSQAELDTVYNAINGLNDVTYQNAPSSKERIIMESHSNYPSCLKTVTKKLSSPQPIKEARILLLIWVKGVIEVISK